MERRTINRVPRRYTPEFKARTLELLEREGVSLSQISRDLDVPLVTLQWWKRANRKEAPMAKKETAEDLRRELAAARAEIQRLAKVNQVLEEEREILKKAAAFFAKESE